MIGIYIHIMERGIKGVRLIKHSKIREFKKIYQKDLTKWDNYVLQW